MFISRTTATDVTRFKQWIWIQDKFKDKLPLLQQPNLAFITDQSGSRSELIDNVETTKAQVEGGQEFMESEGYTYHMWHTMRDGRVRPEHVANDGVTVRIGEQFPSGERYPCKNSINCRCWLEFVKIEIEKPEAPKLQKEESTGKKFFGMKFKAKVSR